MLSSVLTFCCVSLCRLTCLLIRCSALSLNLVENALAGANAPYDLSSFVRSVPSPVLCAIISSMFLNILRAASLHSDSTRSLLMFNRSIGRLTICSVYAVQPAPLKFGANAPRTSLIRIRVLSSNADSSMFLFQPSFSMMCSDSFIC